MNPTIVTTVSVTGKVSQNQVSPNREKAVDYVIERLNELREHDGRRDPQENFPDGFRSEELPVREELHFPPYGHMLTLHFSGENEERIQRYAAELMAKLQPYLDPETIVSDPVPAPIERIKGKFRYMAAFRGGKLGKLKQFLRAETCWNQPRDLQVHLDVDPVSML